MRQDITWSAKELQETLGLPALPGFDAGGVAIDSRLLKSGDLFVAFQGPVNDGHDFIENAFSRGAAGCLSHRPHGDPRVVVVENPLGALDLLAHRARERTQAKVMGITGSYGKTTAKTYAHQLLSRDYAVTATAQSFNNHWGVPLSLANLKTHDDFGIFELGMNHTGEMAALSSYVRPHVALITTIAGAHRGNFPNLEAIADAKCEIFQGMAPGSWAVLPRDNAFYERAHGHASNRGLRCLSFGHHPHSTLRILACERKTWGIKVTFALDGTSYDFDLRQFGDHHVDGVMGVLAGFYALGIRDLEPFLHRIPDLCPPSGRGNVHRIPWKSHGAEPTDFPPEIHVFDDSYNAGPESMKASLSAFAHAPVTNGGRRWVVLGDMLELGAHEKEAHESLLPFLDHACIAGVFLTGKAMKYLDALLPATHQQGHYPCAEDLSKALSAVLQPHDLVLIKGSRGQRAYEGHLSKVLTHLKKAI